MPCRNPTGAIAVAAVVSGSATSMLRVPLQTDLVRDGIVDAHIRSLMDELGIERAHFVGESLGGWVAQYLGGKKTVATFFVVIYAWFVILFTGRFPRGMFDFLVGVGRWTNRVIAYAHVLVTDRYPPFRLAP